MSLDRFGTLLDDYVNGTLDSSEAGEIEALLASSPAARRELEEYRRVVAAVRALPDSLEPETDLWADVASRLEPVPASPPRWPRWLLAAALVAAAAGLVFLAAPNPVEEPGAVATRPAAEPLAAEIGARTSTSLAERDLLAATERLDRVLDEQRDALPPETRELVERNLEIIRGAITEIQTALESDPRNQELNRTLLAYYRHELALLEQVNRAAARL